MHRISRDLRCIILINLQVVAMSKFRQHGITFGAHLMFRIISVQLCAIVYISNGKARCLIRIHLATC